MTFLGECTYGSVTMSSMGIRTLFRLTFGDEWEDKDSAFVVLADLILWSKNKVRCLLDAVSLTLQD
jgi:hypothetical protein